MIDRVIYLQPEKPLATKERTKKISRALSITPAILSLLRSANIPGNLFAVISSFLKDRTATLSLGHCSKERPLKKDVLKDLFLGLYSGISLYLLDKVSIFSCCETIAFADDLLLYFHGNILQGINREALRILDFVSSWAKTYKLEFNASKSKVMIFDRRESDTFTSALTLNEIPLCFVKDML
ncbi:hypothetical protein AVEN_181478-1 [Araneus ventricosus]|uniref:Reverse transcriptase domain-containing protein n=1 Tax=Araneus ventricosus TaxID=182803 RepID=A0A4Y2F5F4_ARAVE|nr:hypothetical protein AVEN_181478-1 [Araneus ventricosus]